MALHKDPAVSSMVMFGLMLSLDCSERLGLLSSVRVINRVMSLFCLVVYRVSRYLGMSDYVGVNYYVGCSCSCCCLAVVVSRRPKSCRRSHVVVCRRQWSLCSSSEMVVNCRACRVS